jgi:hypothetical protein
MDNGPGTQRALVNRVIGQLDTLCDAVTAQEFGRIAQRLLAFSFEALGCSVTENAVGVPDLQVESTADGTCLAIEVKTGNPITISRRDLDGVQGHGQRGVLAALMFPDSHPRWCLVDATTLSPGRIEIRRLARAQQVDVGLDVQAAFFSVVDAVPTEVLLDRTALGDWAEVQRRQGWGSRTP